MGNTRDKHIPAIYAGDAEIVIPDEPVHGASYRNDDLENEVVRQGLRYAQIVDSSDFNQFLYTLSSVLQLVDQQGILGWSNKVIYGLKSIVRGSDGVFYVSQSVNGPGQSNGARDPVINANRPDYWIPLSQDLGVGTGTIDLSVTTQATKVTVVNSSGANATIPAATAQKAGVFAAADKVKLNSVQAGAQVNIDPTLEITNRQNDVQIAVGPTATDTIQKATPNLAGVMSKEDKSKLDGIPPGGGVGSTNISIDHNLDNVRVNSSTGNNDVINAASGSQAGVMSRDDKVKLDAIPTGGGGGANLGASRSSSSVTVTSDSGSNAIINGASTSQAGVMTSADKSKLDGIDPNAEENDPTNLGTTRTATSVKISSSTGTDATISQATTSQAGVMSSAHVSKLNSIDSGADQNRPMATKTQAVSGGSNAVDMSPLRVKEALQAKTNLRLTAIVASFSGGGNVITTGRKGSVYIPFSGVIIRSVLTASLGLGSIQIDVWKDSSGSFPPNNADSITASRPPRLNNSQIDNYYLLSGWTKTVSAGDILFFNVDSVTGFKEVTLTLVVKKTV